MCAPALAKGIRRPVQEHRDIRRTRVLLLALYAALAAAIVIAGYLSYQSYQQVLRAETGSQLNAIAGLKASEISSWREEQVADAVGLVDSGIFGEHVRQYFAADQEAYRGLQEWLSNIEAAEEYEQALLVDAHGRVRIPAGSEETSLSSALATQVAAALDGNEPVATDFFRDELTDRIYLATIAPIAGDAATDPPLGAVILLTDPNTFLYPYIQEWPGTAETAETLLVRRDGADALFLSELKYQENTALELRIPLTRTRTPGVQAALGNEVVMDGIDYRGVPVLAATRRVSETTWGLVARVDADEVYAPLRARLRTTILIVVGALGGVLLGILLVLRMQSARIYRERWESEAERSWLSAAIDSSLNEVYAFDAETLCFAYVNQGGQANIGYTMEELTSMTPIDLKPDYTEGTYRAAVQRLLTGEIGILRFEAMHLRKNGTQYPVVVHLQLTQRGDKRLFLAMINDITERRAAEAELADHREHLELLVAERTEQLQDANEELAAVNEELTASNEELAAVNEELQAAGEETAALNEELASTNEELAATNEELEASNEELQTLYEEAAESGRELERLNSELALADSAKSDFLASMSHELRTPLNSVIGFSDIMLNGLAGDLNDEQARQMEMINGSGRHLLLLINDVLDLSKIEAGRMDPEPELFDLCAVVHEVLETVRPQIDAAGLVLEAVGIDEPCEIVSDARMVRQILFNLLSNAAKFTDVGTVRVTVVEDHEYAEVAVSDTGPGIALGDSRRIFDAFTQIRVRNHRPDGTGLGLAVSLSLASLLGGQLSVVSAPGDGSTFTLKLPRSLVSISAR